MDPQVQHQLMIWGGAFPAGLAIVLLLIFWSIHTRKAMWTESESGEPSSDTRVGPVWLMPVLLVVGLIGAVSAQFPSFQWWPGDNTYRLPHAMVLLGVLGLVEGIFRLNALGAFVLRSLAYAGVFWILASGYRENDLIFADDWAYYGWWGVAALSPALLATLHEQSSKSTPGWIDAGCWMLVIGGMMPMLFFNGYATGATVLPGILAVLGPAAVVGLICKPLTLQRGATSVLIGIVLMMLIGASVHSELRSLPALILLLGAACTGLLKLEGTSAFRYILLRAGIAAVLLGGAALLAHHEHVAVDRVDDAGEQDPYADYDGGVVLQWSVDLNDLTNIAIKIGPRVLLRYPLDADRDEFVALRRASREHLERWEPIPPSGLDLYSPEAFDRELETHNTESSQRWLICMIDTGAIAGRIALGNIERGPFQNGRFGYWIGSAYAGQGLMSEALSLAVVHAFTSADDGGLGLHRVCANVVPSNDASRRVLEKVGFVKEGYSEKYLQIQGVWEDHERWAMTKERRQ